MAAPRVLTHVGRRAIARAQPGPARSAPNTSFYLFPPAGGRPRGRADPASAVKHSRGWPLSFPSPATGSEGPRGGQPGGWRGTEQEKKEDAQTPTPGAALGLRSPRRLWGRKASGEMDRSPASRRAAEDQYRSAVTAVNTAAITTDST